MRIDTSQCSKLRLRMTTPSASGPITLTLTKSWYDTYDYTVNFAIQKFLTNPFCLSFGFWRSSIARHTFAQTYVPKKLGSWKQQLKQVFLRLNFSNRLPLFLRCCRTQTHMRVDENTSRQERVSGVLKVWHFEKFLHRAMNSCSRLEISSTFPFS